MRLCLLPGWPAGYGRYGRESTKAVFGRYGRESTPAGYGRYGQDKVKVELLDSPKRTSYLRKIIARAIDRSHWRVGDRPFHTLNNDAKYSNLPKFPHLK